MGLLSNSTRFTICGLIFSQACFVLKKFNSLTRCGCEYVTGSICVSIIAVVLCFFTTRKTAHSKTCHQTNDNYFSHGIDFRQNYNKNING